MNGGCGEIGGNWSNPESFDVFKDCQTLCRKDVLDLLIPVEGAILGIGDFTLRRDEGRYFGDFL
jgi:hypothetical protein